MSNPSDISRVLLSTQELIDKAVEVVAKTTKTQSVLEKNILITDKKIDIHDKDEKSHEDIRTQVTSSFTHTYPNNLAQNTSIRARVSGVFGLTGEQISYSVSSSIDGITFSKTANISLNEDILVSVGSSVEPGTEYTLTFTFKDEKDNEAIRTITSTINTPPKMDDFTFTCPDYLAVGKPIEISFSGAVDTKGGSVTYSIENENTNLVFSKVADIADNEKITIFATDTTIRGQTYFFIVKAHDVAGATSLTTVRILINQVIDLIAILASSIPEIVVPGEDYIWKIDTIQDPDAQNLHYTVTSENENITFEDAENILGNTNFTCHILESASSIRGQTVNLIITANDGYEDVVKTIPIKINSLPDASTIIQTGIPEPFYGGTENKATFHLSGGSDADGQDFTYEISDVPADITLSKTTGITAEDEIEITATKVETASVKTFKVALKDTFGEIGPTKDITFAVSPKMVTKAPKITYPLSKSTPVEVEYYNGFTMTWSAYEEMADTDMTHTTYPWNNDVAWETKFNE